MRYFKRAAKSIFIITCMVMSATTHAKDFGILGNLYDVTETDMLEMIEAQLKSPEKQREIKEMQQKMKEKATSRAHRPKPVGLPNTTTARRFTYEPIGYFDQDLKDNKGQVFYKANTPAKPLQSMQLEQPLLFFNADDKSQIQLAKTLLAEKEVMLILTQGAPFELTESLQTQVYFDQGGYITRTLGIKQVPAIVTQQESVLLIEELAL